MTNLEYSWFQKLTLGFRVPEAKLRLLDSIKTKSMMIFCRITENIQFRSQEEVFLSSSTGNKLVIVKKEVRYNFKNSFRKPSKNFTDSKGNGHLCERQERVKEKLETIVFVVWARALEKEPAQFYRMNYSR